MSLSRWWNWQQEHTKYIGTSTWQSIVRDCQDFPARMEQAWRFICAEAACHELGDLEDLKESLRRQFDLAEKAILEAGQEARKAARSNGHNSEDLSQLRLAFEELRRMRDKYLFRITLITDDLINEAGAEYAAGNYPTPGAALDDFLALRHAAHITPSYADLRRWADRSPPDPAWLEEGDEALPQ
jgi:hypothetical protein